MKFESRKYNFGFRIFMSVAGILFIMSASLIAQSTTLTEIIDFIPEELKFAGFRLDNSQKIMIEVVGMEPDYPFREASFSNAWILNSKSREVVWNLNSAEKVNNSGKISTFKDELELDPGTYEVYYSTYLNYPDDFFDGRHFWKSRRGIFSRIFHGIFDDDDYRERVDWDLFEEFYFKINGDGQTLSEEEILTLNEAQWKQSFITHTQLKDNYYKKQHVIVEQPVTLNVYAVGECNYEGDYDFAKILNSDSREVIWKLNYRDSEHAGGARKNRMSKESITLEPGEYSILCVTDDSHSYKRWNMHPPFDPINWGLTITFADMNDIDKVKLIDFGEVAESRKIVEFKRMGDDDYRSKAFTLKKALDLHIYAIGEGRYDGMYDFGRIVDAKSRKAVWKMDYDNTESAGGSDKNRLFDGIVHFEPGNYIAYYLTDDSHSYSDWNESPPYDQENWGMSIYVNDKNFAESDLAEYELEDDQNFLIRLTRIGDYEKKHSKFTIDRNGMVHIYALGEGTYGDMYDYAWIENANTGKVVWEMTYRMTDRAGGARKNRVFNDTIYLSAGEYEVYYQTDDSHSFEEWNDAPPYDPESWGITIYYANNE